jgi:erythromycin esterase-like protein
MKEAEGLAEVRAFIERMKEHNGEEIRGVQFPVGVDAYMRDRVLAGDIETVSFMHRLAWMFGVQVGQAASQMQQQPNPSKKRIEA